MFISLLLIGLILAVAPGIVAYISIILFSLAWTFFVFKKGIYKSKYNKMRSLINQLTAFIICLMYIIMEYADVGNGIAIAFVVALLLLLVLLANAGLGAYSYYIEAKSSDLMKQNEEELKKYSSSNGRS